MLFSVPIERVPSSFRRITPATLPVTHLGEHVASAFLRGDVYSFYIFSGDLLSGLKSGSLFLKPRFIDTDPSGELRARRYTAVEIVPEVRADLSYSNG